MSRIAIGDAAVWGIRSLPSHRVAAALPPTYSHNHYRRDFFPLVNDCGIYDLRSNVGSGSINQFVFASSRKLGLLARTRSHQ